MSAEIETRSPAPGVLHAKVRGVIDEHTDFSPLHPASATTLHVDTSEVFRINSMGVKAWLDWVHSVERAGSRLVLYDCPPVLVGQLNMIAGFAGRLGRVASVRAPWVCEACGHGVVERIDLTHGPVDIPQTKPCPRCSNAMEFEEVGEVYLEFLTVPKTPATR